MNTSKHWQAWGKWFAILLALIVLALAASPNGITTAQQDEPTCNATGDIPLDPETYARYMKPVVPDVDRLVLPTAYDARSEGIVTPAKNQGSCGSCWAFASVGAMESHLLRDGYATLPIDLSEQQQVSCNTAMNDCCGGGLSALLFWSTQGPVQDTCFPYSNIGTSCGGTITSCTVGSGCPQLNYRVTNYYTVSSSEFKASLYTDGPSYWRYIVYSDFYTFWSSAAPGAVYTQTSGSKAGGHAVLLIGWDDTKGAYLAKNSWGATSGPQDDGTFWIAYSGHANDLGFGMANFDLQAVSDPPAAFNKLSPSNGASGVSFSPTLSWQSSTGAESYDYCYDTTNDNACSAWTSSGTNTSVTLSGLSDGTPYYWQVRANNSGGTTYANGSETAYWSFTTQPLNKNYLPLILNGDAPIIPLNNGDFELGQVGWTEYSSNGFSLIGVLPITAHSGSYGAWLGGFNSEISQLSQVITVPSDSPYLHYWYLINSRDAPEYDYFNLIVDGTLIDTLTLSYINTTSYWVEVAYDLSSYIGSPVNLMFEVTTDSSFESHFLLDDVSFSSSSRVSSPLSNPLSTAPLGFHE